MVCGRCAARGLCLSFLDRQVISLLVKPIKHDLAISDTQTGIVQGPAFGVFFAILLWSAMIIASGLAKSFAGLLLARIGVGVGEAALVPAAVSLLSEYFPPGRRAMPLSIFTSGISLGLGLSLVLGGPLLLAVATTLLYVLSTAFRLVGGRDGTHAGISDHAGGHVRQLGKRRTRLGIEPHRIA